MSFLPGVRSRAIVIAATGMLGAVLLSGKPILRWNKARTTGIPALVTAAGALSHRAVEGRFIGGFPYRPIDPRFRGSGDADDRERTQLRLVAARAKQALFEERSVDTLHVVAIANTLLGSFDASVVHFREALALDTGADDVGEGIRKCENATLLSDLAAAYQAHGRQTGQAQDFLVALDAAERAWSLSRSAEAAWNRALALDSLSLRNDAEVAWDEALRTAEDPPWEEYARARIQALSAKTRSENWLLAKPRLTAAAAAQETGAVRRMVQQFPQESRTYVEEELLPDWGNALRSGNARASQASLTTAEAIGDALAESGEHIVQDTVLALKRSGARAAKAATTYPLAMRLYREQAIAKARTLWLEVAKELDDAGIPLARRAAVFEATTTYYAGDADAAVARVSPIADDLSLRTRYPTVVAQALWVRALVLGTRGHEEEAIRDTRLAIELFARANELENLAIMQARLATFTDYVGDTAQSSQSRAAALESFAAYGESPRFQSLLLDVARASGDAGLVHATLRLQDAQVRVAQRGGDFAAISSAYRLRSLARWKAGLAAGAGADLRTAETAAVKVADAGMRERLAANIASSACTVLRASDPAAAVAAGTKAVEFFERVENRLRLVDSYLDRAMAYDTLGNRAAATADLARASDELELQRARLRGIAERRDFLERWRTLFDAGISLFAAHGDYAAALSFAEETRARGLLDAAHHRASARPWSSAAIAARIPAGTTLVAYAALPDRLIVWSVRRGEVHGVVVNVSRAQLREDVRRLTEACGSLQARCDEELGIAYRRFIRPVLPRLSGHVVFVPDDLLVEVPFAALRETPARPHLVEERELVMASSATIYAARETGTPRVDRQAHIALIGNPALDPAALPVLADLPAAAAEVRQIAALYEHAAVLTGKAATKPAFLEAAERDALIHYAGHVITDTAAGRPPALALAGQDGRLSAEEVLQHDLRGVKLLILSSCGTGRRVAGADGPMGFARVFRLAGVHTVVAAVAPVDDGATQAFFTAFHRALIASGNASTALRSAQLSLIRGGRRELRAPSAWSRFVVII